jgi:hypothetical protein
VVTGVMMVVAYVLPLLIMAGCFYFQTFSSITDVMTRLAVIGVVSIFPSSIILILVLKRILHLVFAILCIAVVLSFLYNSDILSHFTPYAK